MLTWDSFLSSGTSVFANLRALVNMNAPPDGAEGALPVDPGLLPPLQEPEPSATPPKPRRRPTYKVAARHSLFGLMNQHAGASLFVRPLFWTDQHCELLGVHFRELPACDTPVPTDVAGTPPSRGHMRPSQAITTLSDALTEILVPSSPLHTLSSNGVKTVLETLWPHAFPKARYLPDLHLYFGGRVYRDVVRAQVMWNFPDNRELSFLSVTTRAADSFLESPASSQGHNPANLPMMCYLGKSQLAAIRKNIFRVALGPRNTPNEPVWRLQQLRSKMLIPSNDDQDPHLVGIFLAMAQRHFYGLPHPSPRREHAWDASGTHPEPTFHDLRLRILTHDNDTAEFIIYTATVTAGFLRRFHDPLSAHVDSSGRVPGMDIEYTRVPIWPILGLRERMGKALGQDMVGPFDPDEIETWEDSDSDSDMLPGKATKRKRKALSEVLNGSFEGGDSCDEEADEPALTAKKRCLREGSAVGVVI